jgi:hypothetical protein
VPTGTYTFTFTPNSALAPCQNIPQTIKITVVDNCDCEDLPPLPAIAATCNNQDFITLVAPNGYTGTWTIKSKPAGTNPATISGTLLDVKDKDAGTYLLRFKFANIPSDCPDSGFVSFVLSDYKSAGIVDLNKIIARKRKKLLTSGMKLQAKMSVVYGQKLNYNTAAQHW